MGVGRSGDAGSRFSRARRSAERVDAMPSRHKAFCPKAFQGPVFGVFVTWLCDVCSISHLEMHHKARHKTFLTLSKYKIFFLKYKKRV
jgi:uncharacterized protein (DUF983 family)